MVGPQLDADGKVDVVVAAAFPGNTVWWYRNLGTSWLPYNLSATGMFGNAWTVTAADGQCVQRAGAP